jgi:hypothetical protein
LTTAASKPQLLATSQQQQQPQLLSNNGTQIQDYTFNSPVVAQDKLMYLGYHGIGTIILHPQRLALVHQIQIIVFEDKYKPDSRYVRVL